MTVSSPPILDGTYTPPPLKRGDLTYCLIRDADVIVTTWSDAPLSWPRGYAPCEEGGGGLGLVVNEDLARAIQNESAMAVIYWWGIGRTTVAKWRKKLKVTKRNNPGTHRLVLEVTANAREVAYRTELAPEERERRSKLMTSMRLWEITPRVTYGVEWTPEAIALLGTMPDSEVARLTGHTLNAVHIRRRKERIRMFKPERDGRDSR